MEVVDVQVEKLDDFDKKVRGYSKDLLVWQDFWRDAIKNGIETPYDAHSSIYNRYVNIAQHKVNEDTGNYELDPEATQREFAKVVRWARKNGWTIEKKYKDDEFTIRVEGIQHPISNVEFYSTRQVVCEKVQVGTKVVPAVEEHEEPVYEYKCDKVAFLKVEV